MSGPGLVTLLTDFGPGSAYVGQMHGTLARIAPKARVVDLAHDCPPGGIPAAAYVLERSFGHFPEGTIHVAVVDPGVGSSRAILAAAAHGHVFLAPDNGLLGPVLAGAPDLEVRRVENRELMNDEVSPTFHGRDIFAPVAAYLAGGGALADVGPESEYEPARPGAEAGPDGIDGHVIFVDHFGNVVTDVSGAQVNALGEPNEIRVRAGHAYIDHLVRTFQDVPRGVALIYIGSGDHLEIALNGGRACDALRLEVGSAIRVERCS